MLDAGPLQEDRKVSPRINRIVFVLLRSKISVSSVCGLYTTPRSPYNTSTQLSQPPLIPFRYFKLPWSWARNCKPIIIQPRHLHLRLLPDLATPQDSRDNGKYHALSIVLPNTSAFAPAEAGMVFDLRVESRGRAVSRVGGVEPASGIVDFWIGVERLVAVYGPGMRVREDQV